MNPSPPSPQPPLTVWARQRAQGSAEAQPAASPPARRAQPPASLLSCSEHQCRSREAALSVQVQAPSYARGVGASAGSTCLRAGVLQRRSRWALCGGSLSHPPQGLCLQVFEVVTTLHPFRLRKADSAVPSAAGGVESSPQLVAWGTRLHVALRRPRVLGSFSLLIICRSHWAGLLQPSQVASVPDQQVPPARESCARPEPGPAPGPICPCHGAAASSPPGHGDLQEAGPSPQQGRVWVRSTFCTLLSTSISAPRGRLLHTKKQSPLETQPAGRQSRPGPAQLREAHGGQGSTGVQRVTTPRWPSLGVWWGWCARWGLVTHEQDKNRQRDGGQGGSASCCGLRSSLCQHQASTSRPPCSELQTL